MTKQVKEQNTLFVKDTSVSLISVTKGNTCLSQTKETF